FERQSTMSWEQASKAAPAPLTADWLAKAPSLRPPTPSATSKAMRRGDSAVKTATASSLPGRSRPVSVREAVSTTRSGIDGRSCHGMDPDARLHRMRIPGAIGRFYARKRGTMSQAWYDPRTDDGAGDGSPFRRGAGHMRYFLW